MKKSKSHSIKVWGITSSVIVAVLLVVNILLSTVFYNLVSVFLGSDRIEYIEDEEAVSRYTAIEGTNTKETALAYGNKVTEQVCEEGFILLKNTDNALPVAKGTKISIFGKNSSDMAVGGSGSGGASSKGAKTIFESLTEAGFEFNPTLKEFYDSDASGKGRDSNPSDLDSGKTVTLGTGETPLSSYTDNVWKSCTDYSDLALIVITRIGGEGFDLPRSYLKLDENEKALIEKVKSMGFKKVVILLNTANTLELNDLKNDSGIDAILWTGFAGTTGIMALGRILNGTVTPSGHTVDTYATLESNPSWENFGAEGNYGVYMKNGKKGMLDDSKIYYVKYEESIYVGYRYYETAYAEALKGNYSSFDYDSVVAYPFGYGLSYTSFDWELVNKVDISTTLEKDTEITLKVKVTNTGSTFGRDVVELYVTAPYYKGGLEKSAKVLVAFAKTDVLQPGESQIVELKIDSPYTFASYDTYGKNEQGFSGYVLEKGDYVFTISTDAHNAKDMKDSTVTMTLSGQINFETDPVTGTTVENLFTGNTDASLNSDAELVAEELRFSRSDFAGTWPERFSVETAPIKVDNDYINKVVAMADDINNYDALAITEMPETAQNNGLSFADMEGLDFDDEKWDRFIEELTVSEMLAIVNNGGFHTESVVRLGVPRSTAADGPVGWTVFLGDPTIYDTVSYCAEVVLASTWNIDRLYDMGESVGNEGLVGNEKGDGAPYTGWYAPGLNIHRSPMGGRNFEYYSEDPLLNGKMTTAVMQGAASKGVYVAMKHFAANEQETHRSNGKAGLLTWMTEQSLREIYLKGFEIAVKTSSEDGRQIADGTYIESEGVKAMGIMSSFNSIGMRWTGGDYRLITQILRNEWGFHGVTITDFNTVEYMNVKVMAYAGGNHNLEIAGMRVWSSDEMSAADVTVLQKAAKEVLYVVVNSNAFTTNFRMRKPVWQIVMYSVDGVIALIIAIWGILIFTSKKQKEEA